MHNLVVFFALIFGLFLVGATGLIVFRLATRLFGVNKVVADGVVLAENGLEVLGLVPIYKRTIKYAEVEGVERLPGWKRLVPGVVGFRYSGSTCNVCTRFGGDIIVIKLRGPRAFRHLVCTPSDPGAFSDELKLRAHL